MGRSCYSDACRALDVDPSLSLSHSSGIVEIMKLITMNTNGNDIEVNVGQTELRTKGDGGVGSRFV